MCLVPVLYRPLLPLIYSRARIYNAQVAVFDLMLRLFLLRPLLAGFVRQVDEPASREYNFDNTVIQKETTKYGLSGAGIEKGDRETG